VAPILKQSAAGCIDDVGGPRVKFVLEVDLDAMAADGAAGKELGRILRYWAGAVQQVDLKPGQGSAVYDSAYREVGRWSITDASDIQE
jgi:hypothetical protein